MNQYILINRIKVQNANAIAGFTWGFPAITHFLGFTHNLSRKLIMSEYKDISVIGCAVIAHEQHVHTYRSSYDLEFTQSRNPPYLQSHNKQATPPVIEEGKMNMTVSLLIGYEGNLGNRIDGFIDWLNKTCLLQRLAGGTILDIKSIEPYTLNEGSIRAIKRKLLPGFVLMDRSSYLEKHYQTLQQQDQSVELLDAWLDFAALKQKARPKSRLIKNHFNKLIKNNPDNSQYQELTEKFSKHLMTPYQEDSIPDVLNNYFTALEKNKANEKLLVQWKIYCNPDEKTDADWEYISKPETGYLVPIMTGYKAISEIYTNNEVKNTRDNETDVCFVESVHSVGEWLSVHGLKNATELGQCLWHYHYQEHWYLCKQEAPEKMKQNENKHAYSY